MIEENVGRLRAMLDDVVVARDQPALDLRHERDRRFLPHPVEHRVRAPDGGFVEVEESEDVGSRGRRHTADDT